MSHRSLQPAAFPGPPFIVDGAGSLQPSGFTLVELLIAATMMAILFVGVGAHLRGGVTVWRRATDMGETLQRQRIALERLERDVANACFYDDRDASYGEDIGKLPKPRMDEAHLAWFTVSPTPRQPLPTVRVVTYQCAEHNGAQGLWRTSQSIGEARARRAPEPELVLPGCEELSIRYAVFPADAAEPVEWRAAWEHAERALPRLLAVTIRLTSGAQLQHLLGIPIGNSVLPASPPS